MLKKFRLKSLLLFVSAVIFVLPVYSMVEIEVLKVYDGDSILAKIKDNVFRIRLIGIDCFEGAKSQRAEWQAKKYGLKVEDIVMGGNFASKTLNEKLKNKKVYFEFQGIDKYSRALGVLYVDNKDINKEMLSSPYCDVYKKRF